MQNIDGKVKNGIVLAKLFCMMQCLQGTFFEINQQMTVLYSSPAWAIHPDLFCNLSLIHSNNPGSQIDAVKCSLSPASGPKDELYPQNNHIPRSDPRKMKWKTQGPILWALCFYDSGDGKETPLDN